MATQFSIEPLIGNPMRSNYVYWNGAFFSPEQALVPIRGCSTLFGDGLFTTICLREGQIEGWSRHLARLRLQAEGLRLELPMLPTLADVAQLARLNSARQGLWRLKLALLAGEAATEMSSPKMNSSKIGLPRRCVQHSYMELHPCQLTVNPLRLQIYPEPIASPLTRFKSLAYLERLWLKQWALDQGYDDTLTLAPQGCLTEASTSAICWVDDNCLYYPSKTLPRLPSISLQVLREVATVCQLQPRAVYWTLKDVPETVQWYLCNSLAPLQPVISCAARHFLLNLAQQRRLFDAYLTQVGRFSIAEG